MHICHLYVPTDEISLHVFCYFLNECFCLLLSVESLLCVIYISPLLDTRYVNIFNQSVVCVFIIHILKNYLYVWA